MIYIPALLIVGFYFEQRRALANGIANSGSGVGTFLYAPLCRYLQDMYTWRGALLILAGLLLNCLVCAALFRPVQYKHCNSNTTATDEWTAANVDQEKYLISGKKSDKQSLDVVLTKSQSEKKLLDLQLCKSQSHGNVASAHICNKEAMPVLTDTYGVRKGSMPASMFTRLQDKSHSLVHVPMPTSTTFHSTGPMLQRSGQLYRSLGANMEERLHLSQELLQKPMYRKDAFYSGSIWKLPQYANMDTDRTHYPGSVLRLPEVTCSESAEGRSGLNCSEINYVIHTLIGASLLRNPVFVLCVSMSVLWTSEYI